MSEPMTDERLEQLRRGIACSGIPDLRACREMIREFDRLEQAVDEEIAELKHAITTYGVDDEEQLSELADVLGLIVHAAVKLGFTMEAVERREIAKLKERFTPPAPYDVRQLPGYQWGNRLMSAFEIGDRFATAGPWRPTPIAPLVWVTARFLGDVCVLPEENSLHFGSREAAERAASEYVMGGK